MKSDSANHPAMPGAGTGVSLATLTSRVRHDLRNPLSDILGFSEILQEEAAQADRCACLGDLKAIHQLATDLLEQVNLVLAPQKVKSAPDSLTPLDQQIRQSAQQIIDLVEQASLKCDEMDNNGIGDDLLRISGAARRLTGLLPMVQSLKEASQSPKPAGQTGDAPRAAPETGSSRIHPETAGSVKQDHGSLLVVDDEESNRALLARRLRRQGYTVSLAENGRQALAKLDRQPFDLVLLDILMPEMDGYEVLQALKQHEHHRHLPVIMTSAIDDLDSVVRCILRGADDYLTKPFDPVVLRARVGNSLEKKRLRDLDRQRVAELQTEKELLEIEKDRSERLLLNILPWAIAERLKQGEKTIANGHPQVTVLFADLVGFTSLARQEPPAELVGILNTIFTTFDLLVERARLEKIKTIGDSYMVAGGIPVARDDHAQAVAAVGLEMVTALARFNSDRGTNLAIRVGINTGPVVAGVIGKRKFTYDLWGDTVNVASRMESSGLPGEIQVSESTYHALKEEFVLDQRGTMDCKGIGEMTTFLLKGRKDGSVVDHVS
jgi:class 3 adenylate cyclase